MNHTELTVLNVLAPPAVGGLQRVVEMLVVGLRRRGHRIRVLAHLETATHPLQETFRAADVPVDLVPAGRFTYLRERRAVGALLNRMGDGGIVHTHGYRTDVLDGTLAARMGLPTVTTLHGFTGGDLKNRVYEKMQLRAIRRFDAVVAVSRPMASQLRARGFRTDRLHEIPNAWVPGPPPLDVQAARETLGIGTGRFTAGWVGRLSHEKGPDVFVRALAAIRENGVSGVVIGTGRDGQRLEALAGQLGVRERLSWLGLVPDAARTLAAFDCLVLSSHTEGTPIVLFEAMAAGVPIVATAVGGVPDVVSDGEALLVPPNDPEALARAVEAVRADPAAARRRAAAARARLETDFAADPWLDAYENVYRHVLARRR